MKKFFCGIICVFGVARAMQTTSIYAFDPTAMRSRIILARNACEFSPIIFDMCRMTMFVVRHISFNCPTDTCNFDDDYALSGELHAKCEEYRKCWLRSPQARKKLWMFLFGSLVLDFKNPSVNFDLQRLEKLEARAVSLLIHFFTDIGYQPLAERSCSEPFSLSSDRKYLFAIVGLLESHVPVVAEKMYRIVYQIYEPSGTFMRFSEYQKMPRACAKSPACNTYFLWFDDFWGNAVSDDALSADGSGAVRYFRDTLSLIEHITIAGRTMAPARK